MRREEEIDLVRKAKGGDTAAFAVMIRRYQNLVYATAFQILKDTALAEDVAQEAFVTAFQSLRDLRTESSFPPWLRKITRNLALASRKEQRRFGALEEAGVLQSPPADAGQEVERERREADAFGEEVRRIVSSLSDTLRFPVLLCHIDDLSTRDAARFLGITEGAVEETASRRQEEAPGADRQDGGEELSGVSTPAGLRKALHLRMPTIEDGKNGKGRKEVT